MNRFKYLEEVIIIFEKFLKEFGGEVVPCTNKEIDILESMLPHPYHLPAAYKEFLLYSGKNIVGHSFTGDIFYHGVKYWIENRKEIVEIIYGEDSDSQLPLDIFVIHEYLGGSVEYFKLTEGEDPPVYSWNEEDGGGLEVAKKNQFFF